MIQGKPCSVAADEMTVAFCGISLKLIVVLPERLDERKGFSHLSDVTDAFAE